MTTYTIYATDSFKKLFSALDRSEQIWIEKIKSQLEQNPAGKILTFSWFREKRYLNKRLFFLIDEEGKKILLVSFASKKDQQEVIDFIKSNMKEFLKYLKRF